MIKLLNKLDYLDMNKIIIENQTYLGLNETEAMILLKVSNLVKSNSNFSINKLLQNSSLSKRDIESVLSKLTQENLISIVYSEQNNIITEKYTIEPLLDKIEKVLHDRYSKERIIELVQDAFQKLLSTKDITVITSLDYSFEEVRFALSECLKRNVRDVTYLKKVLESNDK